MVPKIEPENNDIKNNGKFCRLQLQRRTQNDKIMAVPSEGIPEALLFWLFQSRKAWMRKRPLPRTLCLVGGC